MAFRMRRPLEFASGSERQTPLDAPGYDPCLCAKILEFQLVGLSCPFISALESSQDRSIPGRSLSPPPRFFVPCSPTIPYSPCRVRGSSYPAALQSKHDSEIPNPDPRNDGERRPVSIQNMFCMLQRQFETELAEACAPSNYNIGLLPWSPLAAGVLSDKYFDAKGKKLDADKLPEGCRARIAPGWMARYSFPRVVGAAEQYAVRPSMVLWFTVYNLQFIVYGLWFMFRVMGLWFMV